MGADWTAFGAVSISSGWLLVPLLALAMLCDLRLMRLPDWLVGLLAILFVVTVPWQIDGAELVSRLAATVVVFAVCLAGFALRVLGGGDVKLLSVLVLFVPSAHLGVFALLLSVFMIASLIVLRTVRRRLRAPGRWHGLNEDKRFPLGLAIGGAGLALIAMQAGWPGHLPA